MVVHASDARKGTTKLRVVDPYDNPEVWAIVDEGANSNTHSDHRVEDATAKRAKLSVINRLRGATVTKFSGVGSKASSWKYTLPCGLRLEESRLMLPGPLD